MRTRISLLAFFLAVPTLMFSEISVAQSINYSADQRPLEKTIRGRGIARYAVTSTQSLLNNAQRYAINLPSPINEIIGITDAESAAVADVELWLLDADGAYARCQLVGGDEVNISPAGVAHVTYKLTVRQSGDRIRGNTCTYDMDTDPGDMRPNSGVLPMIAEGDLAVGVVIVGGVPVAALSGPFE